MPHLLTPVLTMLSPRRPPRGPWARDAGPAPAWTLRSRARRWTLSSVAAIAAVVAAPTRVQGEPAPVPSVMSVSPGETAPQCQPLAPFVGDRAALLAAGRGLVARGKQSAIGSPRHTDAKLELIGLFLSAGDLSLCSALRATRATRSLSPAQARTITCRERQFCRPMPLAHGCPAGMRNLGPEGCAPIRSCTAAGAGGQAAACKAGDTGCCAPALLQLEIADAEAGMPTPESLAARRTLASLACAAGHAEVCLEAAALGIGTPAAQRTRACSLGHVESCRPSATP